LIYLLYIVYFAYNGTLESHVYDQEFIIIRLFTEGDISDLSKWQLIKCFGSIHGGGMWYDNINIVKTEIDGQLRPVFYSAKESHAMYHKPGLYKRIFRFGDDLAGSHKLWNPRKVICMIDSRQDIYTNIYNYETQLFENNILLNKFYRFNGLIGNINQSSKQAWAGSNVYIYLTYYYDTVNTLPFPKYEGGISNLFVGKEQKISKTLRYSVFYSCVIIWFIVLFIALYYLYMSYKPLYKFTKLKLVKFIGLSILVLLGIVIYFIVSFYIGLDLFIINDNYYQDKKVRHLIMVDDDN